MLDKLGDLVFQAAYVVQIGAQVVGDAAKQAEVHFALGGDA